MRPSTSARRSGSLVALGADSTAAIRSSFQKTKKPRAESARGHVASQLISVYSLRATNTTKASAAGPARRGSRPTPRRRHVSGIADLEQRVQLGQQRHVPDVEREPGPVRLDDAERARRVGV